MTARAPSRHCDTGVMTGDDSAPQGRPAPAPSQTKSEAVLFSSIYRDYFDFVWSCTRRLGVSGEATDDVVQEIFVVIHSRLHTLERSEALRSWIYGIVRRTVSTYRRSRRVGERAGAVLTASSEAMERRPPTPQDRAEQTERVELLRSLLGDLDEPKREVFVLAELQEMTVPEIAQSIGIPVNTAYSRLRAARQAFEEALARRAAQREPRGRPWGS
jgi:RNA polymerase sigma-70 factor (ECF subfamily)